MSSTAPSRSRSPLESLLRILKVLLGGLVKVLSGFTFFVPYLYVLRFPILIWLVFVTLPYFAMHTGLSAIAQNLFDLTERGMFALSLAAFTTSWTIMLTATIILIYSAERFGFTPSRPVTELKILKWRYALPFFWLSALPMLLVAFHVSQPFTKYRLINAVLGMLVSFLLLALAYVAQPTRRSQRCSTFSFAGSFRTTTSSLHARSALYRASIKSSSRMKSNS
jgi:hypothetical protein